MKINIKNFLRHLRDLFDPFWPLGSGSDSKLLSKIEIKKGSPVSEIFNDLGDF